MFVYKIFIKLRFLYQLFIGIALSFIFCSTAYATGEMLIDTELNNTIRVLTSPLIQASGLHHRYFKFHILNIPDVNAFTTSNGNIFINSGLIIKLKNVNAFQGVIAHEMGHAAEEHIPRTIEEQNKTFYAAAAALLLVIPLSIFALPASVAGTAIFGSLVVGTSAIMNLQLAYARANETIADNYAIHILRVSRIDPNPFLNLMQKFANFEPDLGIWKFFQNHPQSLERLQQMRTALSLNPYAYRPTAKVQVVMYDRMRTKLDAYLHPDAYIQHNKPKKIVSSLGQKQLKIKTSKSLDKVTQYGLAMAYYVKGKYGKSQKYLSYLLTYSPKDPFYREMQADLYKSQGKVKKAMPIYKELLQELPWADSMRMDYASLLLMSDSSKNWKESVKNLDVLKGENTERNPYVWYLYLKAYGKLNQKNNILMARAKYNQIIGNCPLARKNARSLKKLAKKGSGSWIVANDVLLACKNYNPLLQS